MHAGVKIMTSLRSVGVARAGAVCVLLLLVLVLLLRYSGVTVSRVLSTLQWQEAPDISESSRGWAMDMATTEGGKHSCSYLIASY